MATADKFYHTYIYDDFSISRRKDDSKTLLLYFYFKEHDSISLMRDKSAEVIFDPIDGLSKEALYKIIDVIRNFEEYEDIQYRDLAIKRLKKQFSL